MSFSPHGTVRSPVWSCRCGTHRSRGGQELPHRDQSRTTITGAYAEPAALGAGSGHPKRAERPRRCRAQGFDNHGLVQPAALASRHRSNYQGLFERRLGLGHVRVLLHLAGLVLQAIRWHLLLRGLGIPASWRVVFLRNWTARFFSMALPSQLGGDAYRVFGGVGVPARKRGVATSIVLDRLIGLVASVAWLSSWGLSSSATQPRPD